MSFNSLLASLIPSLVIISHILCKFAKKLLPRAEFIPNILSLTWSPDQEQWHSRDTSLPCHPFSGMESVIRDVPFSQATWFANYFFSPRNLKDGANFLSWCQRECLLVTCSCSISPQRDTKDVCMGVDESPVSHPESLCRSAALRWLFILQKIGWSLIEKLE